MIMIKSVIKIIILVFIAHIARTWLLSVDRTWSYFSDTEKSVNNTYSAGVLYLSIYSGQNNFVPEIKASGIGPGDEVSRTIKLRNEGNIPFRYNLHTEQISGNNDFCQALELEAAVNGKLKYPFPEYKSLMDFNFYSSEAVAGYGVDDWHFKVSLPIGAPDDLKGKTCEFDFVFAGWQDNPSGAIEGFSDGEKISSAINASQRGENKNHEDFNQSLSAGFTRGENGFDDANFGAAGDGGRMAANSESAGNDARESDDYFVNPDTNEQGSSVYQALPPENIINENSSDGDEPDQTPPEVLLLPPADGLENDVTPDNEFPSPKCQF